MLGRYATRINDIRHYQKPELLARAKFTAGLGLEPRLDAPEASSLPLADPATYLNLQIFPNSNDTGNHSRSNSSSHLESNNIPEVQLK